MLASRQHAFKIGRTPASPYGALGINETPCLWDGTPDSGKYPPRPHEFLTHLLGSNEVRQPILELIREHVRLQQVARRKIRTERKIVIDHDQSSAILERAPQQIRIATQGCQAAVTVVYPPVKSSNASGQLLVDLRYIAELEFPA